MRVQEFIIQDECLVEQSECGRECSLKTKVHSRLINLLNRSQGFYIENEEHVVTCERDDRPCMFEIINLDTVEI